jgi:hypothetical protein
VSIEKLFAAVVLAACAVMLVRMLFGASLRYRFDAAVRRAVNACRRRALTIVRWRSTRRKAERAAEAAIRRAHGGEWDGNVYKTKTFRRPRKPH